MECFCFSKEEHRLTKQNFINNFPYLRAFGHEKFLDIKPTSLPLHYNKGIEICYVAKGKYEWDVEKKKYTLLPGNGFVTCPWQHHGSAKGFVDLGEIWWIIISPKIFNEKGKFRLASASGFSKEHESIIGKTLVSNNHPLLNNTNILQNHFMMLYKELVNQEFGYDVKVQHIIEMILMTVVRLIQNHEKEEVKEIELITRLENQLKENLNFKWSVDQMAAANYMGTTSFNEKIKKLTGFTPSSYLIQLRIAEAQKQLLNTDKPITNIALDCGFSSSQHFSGTFVKRTGISPNKFRGS